MTVIPREERLLNLLSALLASSGPLSFGAIRGHVAGYDDRASAEAMEKRFDRDKSALRKLGVPLEFVPEDGEGRSGYRVARERFFLEEIRISTEEGIVLAALQKGLAGDGGPMEESLGSALAKIGVDSPLCAALRESVAEQQLLDPRITASDREVGDELATFALAVAGLRPIRFRYYALGRDETGERVVHPYGMGYFKGRWYLVGLDRAKGEVRSFRVSRIRSEVEVLEEGDYRIPDDFSLRKHVGVPSWELRAGPAVTARIRFSPEVAWMLSENLRSGQTFVEEPGGGGVLTLTATDTEALVKWVARYGVHAELLEPAEVRERLTRHFREVCER